MSSNLFTHYKKLVRQGGFLTSRLILISLAILLFSVGCSNWWGGDYFIEEKNKTCLSLEGKPDKDVELYWEEFKKARSQETFAIHWHPESGTPEAIFGRLDKLDNIAETNIRGWLLQNKALFKINNLDDLILARNFETPIGKHFIFQQENKIVENKVVKGGQIAVHLNYDHEIIAINNTYVHSFKPNLIDIKVKQKVALEFAKLILKIKEKVALDKIQISEDDIELRVYFFNEEIKVAWRFVISTPNNTWEIFIDTQNKIGLGKPRDINKYFAESNAKVFNINPIVALCDFKLDRENIPEQAYKGVTLKGLEGKGYLDGEYVSTANTKDRVYRADNNFYFENHKKEGFSETMVYYYVDYAQRYIQELGFNNIVDFDDKKNKKPIVCDVKNIDDNTHYDPCKKTLLFGAKSLKAKDAEIIIHEYGHAVQDYQVPGFGPGKESKAIGEGFGDYLAASIGAHAGNNCSDTCIGEWMSVSSCREDEPNCLRRLDTDKKYPYPSDSCTPHCNGEIWSATLWKIREYIRSIKVDTNNKFTVPDADKIILQSHFLVTSTTSFKQAANAIVTAAINLKKQGKIDQRINIESIKKCFIDKGISDKGSTPINRGQMK